MWNLEIPRSVNCLNNDRLQLVQSTILRLGCFKVLQVNLLEAKQCGILGSAGIYGPATFPLCVLGHISALICDVELVKFPWKCCDDRVKSYCIYQISGTIDYDIPLFLCQ